MESGWFILSQLVSRTNTIKYFEGIAAGQVDGPWIVDWNGLFKPIGRLVLWRRFMGTLLIGKISFSGNENWPIDSRIVEWFNRVMENPEYAANEIGLLMTDCWNKSEPAVNEITNDQRSFNYKRPLD